jgi:hypothetical protein
VRCLDIALGEVDINPNHFEATVSQDLLEAENVTSISYPHHGCGVAQGMGRTPDAFYASLFPVVINYRLNASRF